jgi:hypothetical protein
MEIIGVSGLYSDIELLKKPRLVMQLHAMHAQPDLLNVMLLSAICIGHPSASGGSERKGEEVVSIPSSALSLSPWSSVLFCLFVATRDLPPPPSQQHSYRISVFVATILIIVDSNSHTDRSLYLSRSWSLALPIST